ncbi:MAG TPA: alkaline phosphatase family protein [Polyangia bacterium]|nr:alkaline phosphatase family protein [Polyangia bacterium]
MPRRTWLLAHATLYVLAGALSAVLADTYPRRLSARRGHFLVHTVDEGSRAALDGPESVVVTVADGLGAEAARHTQAVAWFRAHGRCFLTDVGSPSVSRPVYAVLSSGVEQDRTGVRGNEDDDPAPVRSVWEQAREAGWKVRVVSSLPWWKELFPRGFDEALELPHDANFFEQVRPHELDLLHVLYIDHAGHEQGAGSREYVAAVRRFDRELSALIARTNLDTSLLVLTADHGHSIIGGHGGSDPRVATVISCFAGKNVQPDAALGTLRTTAIAPALALLTGVPFPPHMRAVDDDLDAVLTLVRADDKTRPYLEDRAQAVEAFRARNRERLAKMTGSVGSWDEFYRQRRHSQAWHWALTLALLAVVLVATSRRLALAWALGTIAVITGAFWVTRGSFDLTAMNTGFLARTAILWLTLGSASALLLSWLRGADDALRMQAACTVALLGVTLGHIAVYGLILGFPIPPPPLLFMPYFTTVALVAQSAIGLGTVAFLAARLAARPAAARPPSAPGRDPSEADDDGEDPADEGESSD